MFEFELELTEDIYFTIICNAYKGYPATYSDPGCDDEIEIVDIKFYGESLSNIQQNSFIEDYGEEDLHEWCWDQIRLEWEY